MQSQSQNYLPQNLPDTEYQEESPSYVPEPGGYMYKNSEQQENYTFYQDGKNVGESESNSPVIYMKSGPNLGPEKLYDNVLPDGYDDNQNQPNGQVQRSLSILRRVILSSICNKSICLGHCVY